ncbi:hypothetical protein SAE02_17280 [Skermanella aerolata]|uniref:Copper chaperone PCu(A)C n=1 Tax=Skermanella aerolata TaxID=393310 RepID=A0A512DN42_9PROT|nr:copper chaperone PCu(A)C [Skermanella aerolata]GEO37580.1 hypothetical protein SAE02_17280 [Skermanella aerolata]
MNIKNVAINLGMALCLAGWSGNAGAHGYKAGSIEVEHPWARSTAPSAPSGAVYMVLSNEGKDADRLISASTPIAEKAELHTHIADDGIMRMRPVSAVEVVPGSPTPFAPGGLHVMLLGLKQSLVSGKAFPLTLNFEKSGSVTIQVEIQGAGAMQPSHGGSELPK